MQTKATRPARSAEGTGDDGEIQRFFPWLRAQRPVLALTPEVEQGLSYLQLLAGEDDVLVARELVQFSFRLRSPNATLFIRPPTPSVLNRRRRAARLWVNAVLAGDLSRETLRNLTHVWLPQLAGTGPEPRRAVALGRQLLEFIRGAITAGVMAAPSSSLLRHAKALHALDSVLAGHLLAIRSVGGAARVPG